MNEPVLSVRRQKVTPEMREHPLATVTGLNRLFAFLEADTVWSKCTKPQRALLAQLCPPVVDAVLERGSLSVEDMPELPFKVGQQTRDALRRRGLIDDRDRLTGCAVHAWFYAGRLKQAGDPA